MENFTPYSSLAGGVLIGFSAVLMWWLTGRIAGISGILGGLVFREPGDWAWRALFLLGIVLGSLGYHLVSSHTAAVPVDIPLWLLISGGFLVGFGTRMGNGCTSGHGVCGIGRLSWRSMVATLVFMCAGMVSVFVIRHILGVAS